MNIGNVLTDTNPHKTYAGPVGTHTPNPFRKRVTLTASERTQAVNAKTLMSVLNTKPCCYKNRNYTIKKNNITQVKNNEMLLKYTRGFYLLSKDCDNIAQHVNTVSEGLYSYINFSELQEANYVPCDYNPLYLLDPCRLVNGLIAPKAKIMPTHKERMMRFPIPLKKISDCSCALPICNNCLPVDIHDVSGDLCHHHYFPANARIIYYSHRHEYEPHPDPYPHPNYPATNPLSNFSYLKIQQNRKCCPALRGDNKNYGNYSACSGKSGSCNSYLDRKFNTNGRGSQFPSMGGEKKCWSCHGCEKMNFPYATSMRNFK